MAWPVNKLPTQRTYVTLCACVLRKQVSCIFQVTMDRRAPMSIPLPAVDDARRSGMQSAVKSA
ncbi:hypothetical protein NQZ68_018309 [Dissostichus eleginoides]|nr:hypothetical protein NQZ68_018309 [Dissostichus eleginoides]